jgi:hypothetical protein
MTELKTLKDIYVRGDISRINLKEEAIKWIKELKNALWKEEDMNNYDKWKARIKDFEDYYDEEYNSFIEVINWIKHFFNITEEELQEQGK